MYCVLYTYSEDKKSSSIEDYKIKSKIFAHALDCLQTKTNFNIATKGEYMISVVGVSFYGA